MGSRQLRRWLNRPLTDHGALQSRYHGSAVADRRAALRRAAREAARRRRHRAHPVARGASLGAAARSHCSCVFRSARCPTLRDALAAIDSPVLQELHARSQDHSDVADLLTRAVSEDPSTFLRDGDVIAAGYDADLDELRQISTNTDGFLLQLEQTRARAQWHSRPQARVQPRAGLLHRDHAQGCRARAEGLSAPADGEVRGALHHAGAEVVRGQGAERARSCAGARERAVRRAAHAAHRSAGAAAEDGRRRWRSSIRSPVSPSAPASCSG